MEKQIKHFRRIAYSLITMALAIKCSAETTLAWRSLQMGRGWLGQALKPYGPSPYAPSDSTDKIPPTVDTEPVSGHLEFDPGVWRFDFDKKAWVFSEDTSLLFRVNFIRDRIQAMVDALEANTPQVEKQRKCFENAIQHFQEAKMWYGYQLDMMRTAVPDNAVEADMPKDPIIEEPPAPPTNEEVSESDEMFGEPVWATGDVSETADAPTIKKSRKTKK